MLNSNSGLSETEASVDSLVNSGNCTSAGVANLQQTLSFLQSLIGNRCAQTQCEAVSYSSVQVSGRCSSQSAFDGVMQIYDGFYEIQKENTDCGLVGFFHQLSIYLYLY